MKVDVVPGKYVLAVSGGVDSMALLDILAKQAKSQKPKAKSSRLGLSAKDFQLFVAHFNHGTRPDAIKDERLVEAAAKKYGLPIKIGQGHLGPRASEDTARRARYGFLEKVRHKQAAIGIITAHQQDDLIETALLNLIRGTGRLGLSSMKNTKIIRPLLDVPKTEIIRYAKKNHLNWREDPTNQDHRYTRNYLRAQLMPKLSPQKRRELLKRLNRAEIINQKIDEQIAIISHSQEQNELDRQFFRLLPTSVSDEVLAYWLRNNNLADFDRKMIRRLSTALKTAPTGTKQPIYGGYHLDFATQKAYLFHP